MMNLQTYSPHAQIPVQTNLGPLVFLHGFPGARSKQNREIAQKVADLTGRDAIVLLYAGVDDKESVFSFKKCMGEVHAYVANLTAVEKRPIGLVGHSWGGYLALSLMEKFAQAFDRLVLISPLLEFAKIDVVIPAFTVMVENNPQLLILGVEELSREFSEMEKDFPADQMIRKVPVAFDVLYLQARFDDTTPTPTAERKLSLFPRRPLYELVDTDHSFLTNRDWTSDRIAHFFLSGK